MIAPDTLGAARTLAAREAVAPQIADADPVTVGLTCAAPVQFERSEIE